MGELKLPDLPVNTVLPRLKEILGSCSAVLSAPPGSGKTTVVPLALAGEGWLDRKKILLLEPRRLAARMAADRMSSLLGEQVGQSVGYHIRFERKVSSTTRIELVTEGILTRRLQHDPLLEDVGLIIFDEFHERSIHGDLALALCLEICEVREDLRLLVMSATLDAEPVASLMGGVPVISAKGQSFPVEVTYLARPAACSMIDSVCHNLLRAVQTTGGDILTFLPGNYEIRAVERRLLDDPLFSSISIAPLMSGLGRKEQDYAVNPDPDGKRKIILATSIAETSLTIENVETVIDSGWSRLPGFDPRTGLNSLQTVRVSKAAADQRKGRAGRLGPGRCMRLWTENEHHSLPAFHPPEIITADLASLALELFRWGSGDPTTLKWLDPPRKSQYDSAVKMLRTLGAIDEKGRITATGKTLCSLPVHPRLGNILLRAKQMNIAGLGSDVCALLSENDIFKRGQAPSSDILERLFLLEKWRDQNSLYITRSGGSLSGCRRVAKSSAQFLRMLKWSRGKYDLNELADLLIPGFGDRIAANRGSNMGKFLLSSGHGGSVAVDDPLCQVPYLVALQLSSVKGEGRIHLGLAVTRDQLLHHDGLITREDLTCWDRQKQDVVATSTTMLGEITLARQPLEQIDPQQLQNCLLEGLAELGVGCLPWNNKSRQLQARITLARHLLPGENWPRVDDTALSADFDWLSYYLAGIRKISQLKSLDLFSILKAQLSWQQQQNLETLLPGSVVVPSGSRISIDYLQDPPVLSVRIQEMFSATSTPTVGGGDIALVLHLLSPANRPIQVTSDLAGFWQRSYPEVVKELKGRYPKHFWPKDPATAQATRKTKKMMDRAGNKER
ncbi:ATP-dependent helicase HrpB [Desulforhopalus singaporensis]|uniref:ATP-dependent helicase HrpB n=1 Tax=Desulforhopalus singaporensis TaxID=91360 RepID=A0A1H0P3B8_9BACT|nr:ATP-dependent helicase HrpB [Desulforhopalus singaporensis]SDO99463.1 ATP-dependent helicase HrpB [Desulforhopalus singaporensis]